MTGVQTCALPICGTGKTISNPCPHCNGEGRVQNRQRLHVDVPAGIRDGQQLHVAGFGEAGLNGAQAGDLIVTCRVQPHEFFEREGDNLHVRVSISMVKATLGADIDIEGITEDSKIQIKIPEGCQNDQVIRIKGKGMPHFKSDSHGDLYVHVQVNIPKKLTKRQRELLEDFGREMGEEVKDARSPLQKLRDAFN